jgi:two-component sensor histidine kinase
MNRRTTFGVLWERLGEPGSLGLRTALLFIPAGVLGPLFFDRQRIGGPATLWLVVAIAGEFALIAGMLTGKALLHRPGAVRSRPILTLVIMGIAAVLRGLAIGAAALALGLTAELELGYRLGAAFIVSVLLILAIVVSTYDQHRRTVDALDLERARLLDLRITAEERLTQMLTRLTDKVRTSVQPRIREIDAALCGIGQGADPMASVDSLREFMENELRPLSRRLGTEPETFEAENQTCESHQRPRVPLPDRLCVATSFKPLPLGLLCIAAAAAPASRTLTPIPALAFTLIFAATCTSLVFVIGKMFINCRTFPVVSLLITTIVYMSIGYGAMAGLIAIGIPTPPFLLVPALIFCGLVGATTVGYDAFSAKQFATEQLLRETVLELQLTVSSLNQQAWVTQRRIAYVMHGRVQSALHSAALRIASMDSPDHAMIESIRMDISTAIAELDAPGGSEISLSATLDDIANLWAGVCAIEWSLTPTAEDSLDSHPLTSQCVGEITREAINNAIRHGSATEIVCDVSTDGSSVIIVVTDSGAGVNQDARGLGMAMYDHLCKEWALDSTPQGTVLTAVVPFASDIPVRETST